MMTARLRPRLVLLALVPLLAACDGSQRLGGFSRPFGEPARVQQPAQPAPIIAAPTPDVQTAPLPPPGGSVVARGPALDPQGGLNGANGGFTPGGVTPGTTPGLPPAGSTVPISPQGSPTTPPPEAGVPPRLPEPPGTRTPPPRVAARDPAPTAAPSAPTRTGVTGNWTAREAAGGSCRVTLSSAPALDLYKASTSGCASQELRRVNAWELRGDEVYLYEPGGAVAARLKQSANQRFDGAAAKTGAPITLSK